jgi:hypothetical protein
MDSSHNNLRLPSTPLVPLGMEILNSFLMGLYQPPTVYSLMDIKGGSMGRYIKSR